LVGCDGVWCRRVFKVTGVYTPVFIVAGLIDFLAVIAIHWLTPRLEMVKFA